MKLADDALGRAEDALGLLLAHIAMRAAVEMVQGTALAEVVAALGNHGLEEGPMTDDALGRDCLGLWQHHFVICVCIVPGADANPRWQLKLQLPALLLIFLM